MSVIEKIFKVQQEIEVEKDGYNERHEFHYFTEEGVVNAVRKLINKYGLIIVPSRVLDDVYAATADPQGRVRIRRNSTIEYTIYDVENANDSLTVEVTAEGDAVGDATSSRKVWTQARKILYLQVFQIGENNEKHDGDSDKGQREPEPATPSAPVKPSAEVKATLDEIASKITAIVTNADSGVTGRDIATFGTALAEKILNKKDVKQSEWKKDARVLEAVLEAAEARVAEVEAIAEAEK